MHQPLEKVGSPTRARTWDLRINSPSLYQLSYRGPERKARFYRSARLFLAQVPVNAGHDAQGLARDRREQMLAGRVLGARSIRCRIHTVGRPSVWAKTSFGSEPPRFGRIAGFLPVVRSIELTVHFTHGESGSRRVA